MAKLMFFDVDGTLLRVPDDVPESAVLAIRAAVKNGHYAFLCTGRAASTKPDSLKRLPLFGEICQCGTYVRVGEEVLVNAAVEGTDCEEILSILRYYDCRYFIENHDYSYYDPEYMPDWAAGSGFSDLQLRYPGCIKKIDDFQNRISKITGYPSHREEIPEIREALSPWFYVIDHEEYDYIEIVRNGYTKGTGICTVMEAMGAEISDTYGFGDSMNDLPMLETVGTGIVMGEAPEALKERFLITERIREDGIANALKRLGLV